MTRFSGPDWLIQHREIHIELADHGRLMPIITFADTEEDMRRLVAAFVTSLRHPTSTRAEYPKSTIPGT